MASALFGLSAAVTRILYLTGFPKELKTKDIHAVLDFVDYEGAFKIKWKDDTSLLIVFKDAIMAKRAYLHLLTFPPPTLTSPTTGRPAIIKPYDGADAQAIIQMVNSRGQHNSAAGSRSHNGRSSSSSAFPNTRTLSGSGASLNSANINGSGPRQTNNSSSAGLQSSTNLQHITVPEHPSRTGGSPTLPSLPSHPTLNALISSSLGDAVTGPTALSSADPAILSTSLQSDAAGGPRIGDSGKRMLGAALGVRHPGLAQRASGSLGAGAGAMKSLGEHAIRDVQRSMGGLTVAE